MPRVYVRVGGITMPNTELRPVRDLEHVFVGCSSVYCYPSPSFLQVRDFRVCQRILLTVFSPRDWKVRRRVRRRIWTQRPSRDLEMLQDASLAAEVRFLPVRNDFNQRIYFNVEGWRLSTICYLKCAGDGGASIGTKLGFHIYQARSVTSSACWEFLFCCSIACHCQ